MNDFIQIIARGKVLGAKSMVQGAWNKYLQEEAENHSKNQARVRRQSHHGFEHRVKRLTKKYPDFKFEEICCQSWKGQTFEEAIEDAFTVSWPASKGHWKVVTSHCDLYGIAMVKGSNDVYYTTMIVGHGPKSEPGTQNYILW